MQIGAKQRAQFRRAVSGAAEVAWLMLVGCAGSSSPHAQGESAAGSSGMSSLAGGSADPKSNSASAGTASSVQGGGANGALGGTSSSAQGGSGGVDASSSGAAGAAGSATAGGIDFSHGARLLIPQGKTPAVYFAPGDFSSVKGVGPIDLSFSKTLADGPTYPRQFEVTLGGWSVMLNQCQSRSGKYEVSSVEVTEDVGNRGAHMKIEQSDGKYLLTHDGPGNHRLRVTGIFHADPPPEGGPTCDKLPTGAVDIPLAFTADIDIQKLGSVKGAASGCGASPVVLSGRAYSGSSAITLLNDQGQSFYPANVDSRAPLDVIVETEKAAQIEAPSTDGSYAGLVVTGDPQTVRVSTTYGTLLTYRLANTSFIDGFEVKYWSRPTKYLKSPTTLLAMDTTPAVATGKELGATGTLTIGGEKICSPINGSDYMTTLLTPKVCDIVYDFVIADPNAGIPGFLATFVDSAGTCELEVSVPGANGGQGLVSHLSAVLHATN
ncbi:MAG TPA: hypothetical protein VER96_10370 [Polyangiaceae bacterium]|nr:hypothetical protein [Polyangiaceae bacterium]